MNNINYEVMQSKSPLIHTEYSSLRTEEEDMMDQMSINSMGTDLEGDFHDWQEPKSRKKKKKARKSIAVATRTSSRVPRDGIPIAEKAAKRAIARNDTSGTTINSSNPFTILNNSSTPKLCSVLHDLDIERGFRRANRSIQN